MSLAGGLAAVFSEVTQLSLKLFSRMNEERLQHCRYTIADCIVMNRHKRIKMRIKSAFQPKCFIFIILG